LILKWNYHHALNEHGLEKEISRVEKMRLESEKMGFLESDATEFMCNDEGEACGAKPQSFLPLISSPQPRSYMNSNPSPSKP
jgi:hypothetical protein